MMDKDKLFLIIYLNVDGVGLRDLMDFVNEFDSHAVFDDSVMKIVVPVRGEQSRVECINPVLLSRERYKEVEQKFEALQNSVEEILRNMKDYDEYE